MAFQVYGQGLFSGVGVVPSPEADLSVVVGGSQAAPDVVVAENPSGYKIALDLNGTANVAIATPTSNSVVYAIVAYTDDLSIQSSEDTITGNPATCGLLAVAGTPASNPQAPSDATIRSAITADGATGSQASYGVIAYVTVASTQTVITASSIKNQNALWALSDYFYPVGAFYETTDTAFDPNTRWIGTWVEDTAGRMLVAQDAATFDTVGDTGGAETNTHHHMTGVGFDGDTLFITNYDALPASRITNVARHSEEATPGSGATRQESTYDETINILPPYVVVKRWHRTA